jgi:putative drug exporter of the RND superfamily
VGELPRSVVGRVGRWCFRRWWWVLAAWALAIAAGLISIGPLFSNLSDGGPPSRVESVAVNSVLNQGASPGPTIYAVVSGVDPTAAAVKSAVGDTADQLSLIPNVTEVDTPYTVGLSNAAAAKLIAPDRRHLLIGLVLANVDRPHRDAVTTAATSELHALARALPAGATVEVGGSPAFNLTNRQMVRQDLSRAEYSSLPVTLIVLVIVFGGLVAAGLPVIAAAVSVAASMAVLLGFSTFTDVDQNGVTVVTLLGLGLSIDYGLLLIARYREELVAGWAPDVAVARAWATAGRTIMFSALTVAAALSGLLLFPISTLQALGAAGVSIAVVAMLAALTFTAALVGLLKRWLRPSKRSLRRAAANDDSGFFARLSGVVQRRPVLVVVGTAALLLAAGAPLVTASFGLPSASDSLPASVESVRVGNELTDVFNRPAAAAITVVARTDSATLDRWAARWTSDPEVSGVRAAQKAGDGTVSSIGIDVRGDPQGSAARALVARIRADRPPAGQSWVTGNAATLADLLALINNSLPAALGVTLLAMVVLLFAMTGSLVVPLKAILANLVSLGATFGVSTAVFAHGFGSRVLDTITVGALNPFVIVLVFAFAFGLSMDYEVFLLGRIKEQVDHGVPTDIAVRRGLQHTGRVITSAALLMVIVFACFAAARVGNIEEIGLGLTVAVIIDATVVRCLLVPATMTLLGRINWWAPRWLKRLHRWVGFGEHRLPEAPASAPRPALADVTS